jgi:hypothetical protein
MIIFVFAPESRGESEFYSSEKIEFVFDDYLFDTGSNYFVFSRSDINNFFQLNIY